jgi:hypothetical protein
MEGVISPGTPESEFWLHKGTQRRLRNQLGALIIRLARTMVQIRNLPLGGKGKPDHLLFWGETVSVSFREEGKSTKISAGIREVEDLSGSMCMG